MHRKENYSAPAILCAVGLRCEAPVLQGSINQAINLGGVDAVGQETEEIDINKNPFTHEWQ